LIRLRLVSASTLEAFTLIGELMRQPKFQAVTATLVLLSLVISIPGYAYASPGVTEGHWLYQVKRNLEEVELSLKITPEAQAVTLAKLTKRRLEEAAHLSGEEEVEEEKITTTINQALEHDRASQEVLLAITEPGLKEKTTKKIEEKKEEQLKALTTVAQDIGLTSKEETLDTITFALEIVMDSPNKTPWGQFKKHLPLGQDKDEGKEKPPIIPPGQAKKLEQNYEDVINDINELDKDLKEKKYDRMDIKALYERLGKKLEETEEKIEEGSLESADKTLKSTKALTNTAEYFVKEKDSDEKSKKKKDYDEDEAGREEEVKNDYYKSFWEFYKNKNKKIPPGQLKKMDYEEDEGN